jgi:O-antigen/teichoic acid export membrane protein
MLKNVGSNWALAFVQIIVMIQLTPVQVAALGADANGAWLTVASLTSVLGLLILGVPMASVRFIARHAAAKDADKVNQAVASCLGICVVLGVAAAALGAGLSVFFEHVYLRAPAWQVLGPRWIAEARIAYWIAVVQVGLGFVAQLPFGILEAHQEFPAKNTVMIASLLLRLGLTFGVLRLHPSLILVAVIQLGCMGVEFVASMVLVRRRCPGVHFSLRHFDRSQVRAILGFSLFAMLLSMGNQLAFRSDALVIGAFRDPAAGTFFDVGNKFFPPLTGLVLGIGMVVMPLSARLEAEGNMDELRRVFLKWSKIAYSLSLMVGIFLVVLGPEFIGWWMGQEYVGPSGSVVRVLMLSFVFFLPVRGVALPILMGLGKPVKPALALLAMGIVNLGLSLVLVGPFDILGVAVGTALPCVLFAAAVAVFACRELGVSVNEYLRYVASRTSLGVAPAALLLLFLKLGFEVFPGTLSRSVMFVHLLLAGLAMVAVFAATWIFFVYRGDPYFDMTSRVQRFFPGVRRPKAP